jgi:hypothetical protein
LPVKFAREVLIAFFIYSLFSFLLFGWSYLPALGSACFGCTTDVALYIWSMKWCSYAILQGLDIFRSNLIWAPTGYNMAWTTFAPGLAFLASPVTLVFGPVIAYGLTCLLMPALSASACFILCRHITKNFLAALLSGYIFGFSTYEIVHIICHLAITPIFIIPLALYLVLLKLEGTISNRLFVLLLAILLALQFSFSLEVLLTMTIFAVLPWLLALRACTPETRKKLIHLAPLILVSYLLMSVIMSPYLFHLFGTAHPPKTFGGPIFFSVDAWNFILPTPMTLLHGWQEAIVNRFSANFLENDGYVGVPLLVIVVWFIKDHWEASYGYVLIFSLILLVIAALGPGLLVAGQVVGPMPWIVMVFLPLIKFAVPLRFMMYVFLVIAIMVAYWFAKEEPRARPFKIALLLLAVVSLLPNFLATYYWKSDLDLPNFFKSGTYKQYIAPGDIVLVLPYADQTNCLIWQAQADMYFRMAGGYVNELMPPEYTQYKIAVGFMSMEPIPDQEKELKTFLKDKGVAEIIVAPRINAPWDKVRPGYKVYPPRDWTPMLSTLGIKPIEVGGVTLYKIKPGQF